MNVSAAIPAAPVGTSLTPPAGTTAAAGGPGDGASELDPFAAALADARSATDGEATANTPETPQEQPEVDPTATGETADLADLADLAALATWSHVGRWGTATATTPVSEVAADAATVSLPVEALEEGTAPAGPGPSPDQVPPADAGPLSPEDLTVAAATTAPADGGAPPADAATRSEPSVPTAAPHPAEAPVEAPVEDTGASAGDGVTTGAAEVAPAGVRADGVASPRAREVASDRAVTTARPLATDTPAATAMAADTALDVTVTPAPGQRHGAPVSAAVARVLDALELLEHAPPPRVVVIESGEARLRIGLEAGLVRITLLGERNDEAEQLLRETSEALESRGVAADVDTGGRSRGHGRDAPAQQDTAPRPVTAPSSRPSIARAGLQL